MILIVKGKHPLSPLDLKYFYNWRDTLISRNIRFQENFGEHPTIKDKIDLSKDDLFVTFKATEIYNLVKDNCGKFLTIHFFCLKDSEEKFGKLSAAICILEKGHCVKPDTHFIFPIEGVFNAVTLKQNYNDRLTIIKEKSHEFCEDEEGISHEIKESLIKYFAELKEAKVKVIFVKVPALEDDEINGIKVRKGRITVVFAEDWFNPKEDLKNSESVKIDLEDFGGACCPPA